MDSTYVDGQYLASRLSKSITRESTRLKQHLSSYNSLADESDQLSWHEITDLSSLTSAQRVLQSDGGVPKSVKLDSIAAYHQILRAEEEIALIKHEMVTVISSFLKDREVLLNGILGLLSSNQSRYNIGCLFLLQLARLSCERKLCALTKSFGKYTQLPDIPCADFIFTQHMEGMCVPDSEALCTVEGPAISVVSDSDQLLESGSEKGTMSFFLHQSCILY